MKVVKSPALATPEAKSTWLLIEYFDSAVSSASVYGVRHVPPSRFASIITIDNDSIRTFGSMEDITLSLKEITTPEAATLPTSYGKWDISITDTSLVLQEHPSKSQNRFHYRRSPSKFHVHTSNTDFNQFVVQYFNQHILSGTYEILAPTQRKNQKITFGADGSLSKIEVFDRYDIYTFNGPRHPYSESDALTLSRADDDSTKVVAWTIDGDVLSLFDLTNDKEYPGEVFHKGEELMKLKKLK